MPIGFPLRKGVLRKAIAAAREQLTAGNVTPAEMLCHFTAIECNWASATFMLRVPKRPQSGRGGRLGAFARLMRAAPPWPMERSTRLPCLWPTRRGLCAFLLGLKF